MPNAKRTKEDEKHFPTHYKELDFEFISLFNIVVDFITLLISKTMLCGTNSIIWNIPHIKLNMGILCRILSVPLKSV